MTHWFAIMACLLGVTFANAQPCSTRVYSTPSGYTYTTPVVERVVVKEVLTPVAIPVLVPTAVFQYLPALAAPVVAAPPVAVTPAVPVPAPAAAPSPVDIDRLVRERVDAILREKLNTAVNDDDPPPLNVVGGAPKRENPQEIVQQVANLLANRCASCHTAGVKVSGDVTLFVKKGEQMEFRPSVGKKAILAAVTPGMSGAAKMPPTAKTDPTKAVQPTEVALLRRWDELP
jgi:hypothetical protein